MRPLIPGMVGLKPTLRGSASSRYGQWTSLGSTPASDQTYGSRYVLDLNTSYNWDNWTVTIGANDLNNAYPEKSNSANDFGGILPYPSSSPFGFSGAYYYGTVAYNW